MSRARQKPAGRTRRRRPVIGRNKQPLDPVTGRIRPLIDEGELLRLIRQNLSQAEIARRLRVTHQAVHHRFKRLEAQGKIRRHGPGAHLAEETP